MILIKTDRLGIKEVRLPRQRIFCDLPNDVFHDSCGRVHLNNVVIYIRLSTNSNGVKICSLSNLSFGQEYSGNLKSIPKVELL